MKIEKAQYPNYGGCYKLSNGSVEVIASADVGPRVCAYRFIGGENILAELGTDKVVKTELGVWHVRGGHRLWHAPEASPRSYAPDDEPVTVEMVGENAVRLTAPVEARTNIRKEMLIALDAEGTRVTITHKLTNEGLWPVELAPWALTIMNGGGMTIFPQERYIPHTEKLLPARQLTLWHYTDMSDPRFDFGKKYIFLHCNEGMESPQKIAAAVTDGWAAYLRQGTLFVKRFPFIECATYPDFGVNFETYTAGNFMEVETVGPLAKLDPGGSTTHVESWYLFKNVQPCATEDCVDKAVLPLVGKTFGE